MFFLGKFDDEILKLVKWGCIAYLSYLSYRCFIFAQQAKLTGDYHLEHQNKPTFAWIKYVLLGIQSSLLNPKNILFYSSIIMAIYQHYNVVSTDFNLSVDGECGFDLELVSGAIDDSK